ncbi:MAG: alpha/beta hydrolase [Burkholderiaceae bacterium]
MTDPDTLELQQIGTPSAARPTLVFLHEGLGSVSMWRDFPAQLCARCRLPGLVYSRHGYGRSALFAAPLEPDFMHRAADDELVSVLSGRCPGPYVLIGHSDGASIALIHASRRPAALLGAALLAPHLFVEPICTDSIAALARDWRPDSRLARALARHHRDGERTFRAWSGAWLEPRFAQWNIESEVARINRPLLAIQGWDDQYGTMRQIERIRELHAGTDLMKISACGHSPHVDRPDAVIARIAAFVARLALPGSD